jgi:hypothetical protein
MSENHYKFQVRMICPVHKDLTDLYDVIIHSRTMIPVEMIIAWFKQYENTQIFQEELTRKAASGLGARVKITGIHDGIEVISEAP